MLLICRWYMEDRATSRTLFEPYISVCHLGSHFVLEQPQRFRQHTRIPTRLSDYKIQHPGTPDTASSSRHDSLHVQVPSRQSCRSCDIQRMECRRHLLCQRLCCRILHRTDMPVNQSVHVTAIRAAVADTGSSPLLPCGHSKIHQQNLKRSKFLGENI